MTVDSDSDAEVTFNNKMTPGKLKLINSTPMRDLFSERTRASAAAEVAFTTHPSPAESITKSKTKTKKKKSKSDKIEKGEQSKKSKGDDQSETKGEEQKTRNDEQKKKVKADVHKSASKHKSKSKSDKLSRENKDQNERQQQVEGEVLESKSKSKISSKSDQKKPEHNDDNDHQQQGKSEVQKSISKSKSNKQKPGKPGQRKPSQRKLLQTGKKQQEQTSADSIAVEEEKKSDIINDDEKEVDELNITDKAKSTLSLKPSKDISKKTDKKLGERKKRVKRKDKKNKKQKGKGTKTDSAVIYVGHIPHGFYDKEMRSYFAQFGEVLRVRLSRSKKTGHSRGYAFVEFADAEVAAIAAESMDGYLMHGSKMVSELVAKEKVHEHLFKPMVKNIRSVRWSIVERQKLINRSKDPKRIAERSRTIQKNLKKKKDRLEELNINYKFPELSSVTSTAKMVKSGSDKETKDK